MTPPKLKKPSKPKAYKVGYGKPPKATRFKPGQSGNPKGRPKGSKNRQPRPSDASLRDIILQEAYRPITVTENGEQVTISMTTAVMRSIAVNAAKGNTRAQRHFTDIVERTENKEYEDKFNWFKSAVEYKQDWEEEIASCKKHKLPVPSPLPHPDDVHLDLNRGTAIVRGPMTKEQLDDLQRAIQLADARKSEIISLNDLLKRTRSPKTRAIIKDNIAHETSLHEYLMNAISAFASPECVARVRKMKQPSPEERFKAMGFE